MNKEIIIGKALEPEKIQNIPKFENERGIVIVKGAEKLGKSSYKTINEIIEEEKSLKITALPKIEDIDIKNLLRNERGVIPPDFYNKRKTK